MNAEAEPAITTAPSVFIADWIIMFANENIMLCTPAGTPILRISERIFASNLSFFTVILICESVRKRAAKRIVALTRF